MKRLKLTKKEINTTLNDAVAIATSVAYTKKEIQKLKSLLEEKTKQPIVEYVEGPAGAQGLRGPIGATGAQGERGLQGERGEVGPQGEKGEVGPQGNMGLEGPRGLKGDKGDKGDTGAVGPQGEQGIQGIAGDRGEKGEKGDRGADGQNGLDGRDGQDGAIGPVGPTGAQGIQGERGPKGDKGDRGQDGKDGPQGPAGSAGEIGPQGVQGIPGKDGKDADLKAIEQSINQFKEVLQKDITQYKAKVNTLISDRAGGGTHGSGEVNLRFLDDVDRDSIQDGYVLSFSESLQKFTFVEQASGGGGGGTIDVFARTRANNAWAAANSAYATANSAYTQANNANTLAQAAYNYANTLTFSGSGTDNLARSIANSAYATANTKSYTFKQNTAPAIANTNDFWANTDSAIVYYNFGNTASPLWVEFGPTGTSTGGGGNTDLTGYAVNTTVNLVWSNANSAWSKANTANSLAQAAYDYANTLPTSFTTDRLIAGNNQAVLFSANGALLIPGNIIPPVSGLFTLGDSTHKFADIWIGPNTINIQDQTTGNNAQLTIQNGTLFIDNAERIQIGNMAMTTNGISLVAGGTSNNITIGALLDTGYTELRNVGIQFRDGTTQNTAATNIDQYARSTANSAWYSANLAFAKANTAYNVGQAAYDYANTLVIPSLAGYAVNTTVNLIWASTNSAYSTANSAWSTANLAYAQANTAIQDIKATRLVSSNTYTATSSDYYIGVNTSQPVTITLPSMSDGKQMVIKDESGSCATYPITISGTIDNDSGGAILSINNGALHLIHRSGWRII